MTYHIFVGYDEREHEVFQVAKHTLERYATVPIKVHKLHHKPLREAGLFYREWKMDARGQFIDLVDNRPFSTQFTFTRFLVPEIWKSITDTDKSPLVMFVDCDFVFRSDIGEMFALIEQKKILSKGKSPVYVTQHDYRPDSQIKMDGMAQSTYNMKLWAALMVFDMDHPDIDNLTPELVNTEGGRNLMSFCWVKDLHSIGTIPEEWHFIPDHSEKNTQTVKAIHYTEGGAWFPSKRGGSYDNLWWDSFESFLHTKLENGVFDKVGLIDAS